MNITQQEWNDLLRQLSDNQREIILARFYEGKTFKAIGERIGVSRQGAEQACKKAVATLRLLMSETPLIDERIVLIQKGKHGWFADHSSRAQRKRYEQFVKRMKRALIVKVNDSWPQRITYCGPITITLENRKTISGSGCIEAKGHYL